MEHQTHSEHNTGQSPEYAGSTTSYEHTGQEFHPDHARAGDLPHANLDLKNYSSHNFGNSPAQIDWANIMLYESGNDIVGNNNSYLTASNANPNSINITTHNHHDPTDNNHNNTNNDTNHNTNNTTSSIMHQIQHQSNVHSDAATPNMSRHQDSLVDRQNFKAKLRRPCDHCRRRKTRCVIIPDTSNCVQCEAKSLTCTFLSPVKRDEKDTVKRMRPNEGTPRYESPRLIHDVVPPNVQIRDVQPVHDYSLMNKLMLKKTLSLQFPRSSFHVGPTSYLFDGDLMELIIGLQNLSNGSGGSQLNKIEQVNLSDSISLRKVAERTHFLLKDDQLKLLYQSMSNDVDAVEKFVAPHGQILIDLYFRIIHPSYPILHKKVFLEKYNRTHREFSAPLLAAVYVLAIQWWDYDPQLNRYPKPNVDQILRIALNNYLLEILKRPKLSAVQAGLLLLQCKHTVRGFALPSSSLAESASASLNSSFNDSDYNDWVLCSQVVALAEELGLGLDCDLWKLPKWERGLRKRLAWAVYMEDKWLSLKNSRPSHITSMNWVVLELLEEDFPDKHGDGDLKEGSSDINNGKRNFMNLISLSQILARILDDLYSMRAMKEVTDINDVLRIAKPIQLELRTWYRSLPLELQMGSVQPRKLCSNGYLQLAYFAAELTLHRKIIKIIYALAQAGNVLSEDLVNVCRSAAKTRLCAASDFVRDLKPEHIHSFWHSSASSNFALVGTFAALLHISSTTPTESNFYKDQIFNYRWILKISSKGFLQVEDALQKLDLVFSHLPGLLKDSSSQPIVVPNVPTIDYNQVYQQPQPQNMRRQETPSTDHSSRSPVHHPNGKPSRPSPELYRLSQVVQSPYDSPHAFNTPSTLVNRPVQAGANSPQSNHSVSPKEIARQKGPRSGSMASHHSEATSGVDSNSTKESPAVMRSPLTYQKQSQDN